MMAALWLLAGPAHGQITGVVAFGDSLSDIGNTYNFLSGLGLNATLAAGYNPYFYSVGRFSNGPVWAEDMNTRLGLPTLTLNNGSSLTGTDFAWGASTSGTGYTNFFLPNLLTQVSNYNTLLGSTNGLPTPATTLYTVWAGGNDVINNIESGGNTTPEQIASNLATAVTNLYNSGGRYFLVPNLPPLGNKPSYVGTANQTIANNFVTLFNGELATTMENLESTLTGVTIIQFDDYTVMEDILADPSAYGFGNVTGPAFVNDPTGPYPYGSAVADPNSYLFWDNTHPSASANAILGQAAYDDVIAAVPEPAETAMVAGVVMLAGAGLRRRRRG